MSRACLVLLVAIFAAGFLRAQDGPPPPMRPNRPPMERAFHGGPPGRWWTDPALIQKLGLTADQQKRIDGLFQQSRLKLIDLLNRRTRELSMIVRGAASTDHPVMAHIIPIRRCNLSCTYCNEYDDFSKPVAVETMTQRLDQLADLGTSIVTFSGGEPLLHPELDQLIAHVRGRGMLAAPGRRRARPGGYTPS